MTVGGNDWKSRAFGVNGNSYDANGNGNDGYRERIFVICLNTVMICTI